MNRNESSTAYRIIAVLPDGQTKTDEAHLGDAARLTYTTRELAEDDVEHLDADRPEGHEDVVYRVVPIKVYCRRCRDVGDHPPGHLCAICGDPT